MEEVKINEKTTEMELSNSKSKELYSLINNYFMIRTDLLVEGKCNVKEGLRSKIFNYLSFDELSQIFQYLDLSTLLLSRLVNK